jgi:glycosyltransferase involved in cell wall biosynthesis
MVEVRWLIGGSWTRTGLGRNLLAVGMSTQVVISALHLPADNLIVQSGRSLVRFNRNMAMWLRSRWMAAASRRDRRSWSSVLFEDHSDVSEIAVLFIAAIAPDNTESMRNAAWSAAGSRFALGLLGGLDSAGLRPTLILSQQPARRFPRSRLVVKLPGTVELAPGLTARWIPFVNLPLIRPVGVGVCVVLRALCWGLSHRRKRSRVLMICNLSEPPGLAALLGARLARAKAVAIMADINLPGETVPATFRWKLDYWLHKKLLPRFDGIVTLRDEIHSRFAPDIPYLRIDPGLSDWVVGEFAGQDAGSARSPNAPFVVAFAGRLAEVNGIRLMLDAMEALPDPRLRLRIAGRGPLEDLVRQAAEGDLRIEFCGYLDREELVSLYRNADLLLNVRITGAIDSSLFFASKLTEYMASGRPVLSTEMGHVEADYGRWVHMLREETAPGLAEAVSRIMSEDAVSAADRAVAGKDFVLQHRTWQAQAHRLGSFVASVCEK